jgi:site-specific DNA recombinase
VVRILTAEERNTTRPGRGKYLFSGIAQCGVCAGPLSVSYFRDNWKPNGVYRCFRHGHVNIDRVELDSVGETAILAYLRRNDVYEALAAASNNSDAALASVRDELGEARSQHRDLAAQVRDGKLSASFAAMSEPGMLKRIQKLEARERELSTPDALRGFVGHSEAWPDAPMSARREVARLLLSADMIGTLCLNRPDHELRIEFRRTKVADQQE